MPLSLPRDCAAALQAGDPDRALQLAIALLRREPHDLRALAACCEAYRVKGDSANAGKVLEVVMKLAPASAWAQTAAGQLAQADGRLDDAVTHYRRAVEAGHAPAAAHEGLGFVLSELNLLAAGEWHLRRAIELGGPSSTRLLSLGLNLARQERGTEADACYTEARQRAPDDVQALGYALKHREVTGDLEGARRLLQRAEALAPGGLDLLEATLLAREGHPEKALALLEARSTLNGDALLERGRLRDRLGDPEGAWTDWVEGKRKLADAGGLSYNRSGVEGFFQSLKDVFDGGLLADLPRAATRSDSPRPLFIVGAPRSGTTLLERLLCAHPDISPGGELPFVAEWRVTLERLSGGRSFPENLVALRAADNRHWITLLRDQYLALRDERPGIDSKAGFVTDKMPFNEVYLPLIRAVFPESLIILLHRDPRDVAVSMLSHKINHGFHCAYRIEDIAHHLRAVRGLVTDYCRLGDLDVRSLSYEDLVAEPESSLKPLIEGLGLSWKPNHPESVGQGAFVATPSYDQVNRPVNARAVGRHRAYATWLADHFPPVETPG